MQLEEADVRAMVHLVGEVAGLPGGHTEKKRFLMDGVCQLIGADSWAWTLAVLPEGDMKPVYVGSMMGGMTEEQASLYMEATNHPDEGKLMVPFMEEMFRRGGHTTRLRQQTDPENTFLQCASRELWIKAGVYPGIVSARPLRDGGISGIGIYRRPGKADFTERESRIAHIILTEVAWLHELGWPEDRGVTVPYLPPRQRLTLNLLLQGHSRQQIAQHMSISIHTLNGYVKQVFRHFGVQSQTELMRHFLRGDGGDSPVATPSE